MLELDLDTQPMSKIVLIWFARIHIYGKATLYDVFDNLVIACVAYARDQMVFQNIFDQTEQTFHVIDLDKDRWLMCVLYLAWYN